MNRPAVFFDRDNTLIRSDGYLGDPDAVVLVQGAAEAVAKVRAAGFAVVVFSNQSGVARGMFSEEDVHRVNARLDELLRDQDAAAVIDRHEFCPYHPDASVPRYRQASEFRKPAPGMIYQAARQLGLDLGRSWVVGDAPRDIEAGRAAGCRTLLFKDPALPPSPAANATATVEPDFVAATLLEAAEIIERQAQAEAEAEAKAQAEVQAQAEAQAQAQADEAQAVAASEAAAAKSEARAGVVGGETSPAALAAPAGEAGGRTEAGPERPGVREPEEPEEREEREEPERAEPDAPEIAAAGAGMHDIEVSDLQVSDVEVTEALAAHATALEAQPVAEPAPPAAEEAAVEHRAMSEAEASSTDVADSAASGIEPEGKDSVGAVVLESGPAPLESVATPGSESSSGPAEEPALDPGFEAPRRWSPPAVILAAKAAREAARNSQPDASPEALREAARQAAREASMGLTGGAREGVPVPETVEPAASHAGAAPERADGAGEEPAATAAERRSEPTSRAPLPAIPLEPPGSGNSLRTGVAGQRRLEELAEQILQELKNRNEAAADFSVSKLMAGITMVMSLAVLVGAYLYKDSPQTLQSFLLLGVLLQALTISLLIMGRQR